MADTILRDCTTCKHWEESINSTMALRYGTCLIDDFSPQYPEGGIECAHYERMGDCERE